MPEFDLNSLMMWTHDILAWIGFGTVVGLLAKAIMPGRDPGGAVATLLMGIGGTVIGCGGLSLLFDGRRVSPMSPFGFVAATAGAFLILFFYRLLAGYWFVEGEYPRAQPRPVYRRRRRAYATTYED